MSQEFHRDFQTGRHGGHLRAFARRFHKSEDEIIDFSSNVNPLGIPESLRSLYQTSIDDLSRYPDPEAELFREKLAELFHLPAEKVIAGNGSMALLDLAIRTLNPKRALLIEPCFTEYRRILEQTGSRINHVQLLPEQNFDFSLESILNLLSETDLLIFAHPNNPTGSSLDPIEVRTLLSEAQRRGVFVVIDESFVDWVPQLSVAFEVNRFDHLVVVRSMTKFFALAGIRSGFGMGPRPLIEQMSERQGPWTCNRLAQRLSVAALDDLAFQERSRLWLEGERAWLVQALEAIGVFRVYPSRTNFLLIQSYLPTVSFFEFLGARGIYIRPANDFVGLDDSYFRIAVRKRSENEFLVRALSQWAVLKPQNEEDWIGTRDARIL